MSQSRAEQNFFADNNDTLAGFVTTNNKTLAENLEIITKTTGAALPPFDSFLAVRGIKTLAVRMEKHCANAKKIVSFLETHPKVQKVLFAGKGCMISFYVDSVATVERVLKSVKLVHFAESLGGVDSLITYPKTQTHVDVPEDERNARGITDTLLRLSVGIENADDIIEDLRQAIG